MLKKVSEVRLNFFPVWFVCGCTAASQQEGCELDSSPPPWPLCLHVLRASVGSLKTCTFGELATLNYLEV